MGTLPFSVGDRINKLVRRELAEGRLVAVFASPDISGVYSAILRDEDMAEPVRLFLEWLQSIFVVDG